MLSLYIHIPFCQSKCNYCAFTSFPIAGHSDEVGTYLIALKKEIEVYSKLLGKPSLKTLYFGGGTPNLLGRENLISLIHFVEKCFDLENLGELSFEFNPYPQEQIIDIVGSIQKEFGKEYPRIRFSFGIQSFDNEVLQLSGRKSSFVGLVDFLRGLRMLKNDNTVFNFDFIAFGKWNKSKKGNRYLWSQPALEFFNNFVSSWFADSFSLYFLELFDQQVWKKRDPSKFISGAYFGTDEEIYEEFLLLKKILLAAGYSRYEISNFALAGKSSIHNRAYWSMENYLGVGLGAASFFNKEFITKDLQKYLGIDVLGKAVRIKNTVKFSDYLNDSYLDHSQFDNLSDKDYLIESFFLALRTDIGVLDLKKFESILVVPYKEKILQYQKEGLLVYDGKRLSLTDSGMDVFNVLVTDIMQEI